MSEVEIIMGLNSSGKTLFLNTYIEVTNVKKERILVIIIGNGNAQLNTNLKSVYIKVKFFNSIFEIDERKMVYLIDVYKPHRILIEGEYLTIKNIYKIIGTPVLRDKLVITSRIDIINSKFISKVLRYKLNKIYSNIIIINNFDKIKLDSKDIKDIKLRNMNSFLFCIENFDEIYFKFKKCGLIKSEFEKNVFKYLKEYI